MSNGKKNYFRHHNNAHNDDFIVELIEQFGYQGYFVWWTMIELAAQQENEDNSLVLSELSIRRNLRITPQKFHQCIRFMERKYKIRLTKVQLPSVGR